MFQDMRDLMLPGSTKGIWHCLAP